jgi:hypothetical protein
MHASAKNSIGFGDVGIRELGEREAGLHARVVVQPLDWRCPCGELQSRGKCLAESMEVSNRA